MRRRVFWSIVVILLSAGIFLLSPTAAVVFFIIWEAGQGIVRLLPRRERAVPTPPAIKPPLGIEPQGIWAERLNEQRVDLLVQAIRRYQHARLEPPAAWWDELEKRLQARGKWEEELGGA